MGEACANACARCCLEKSLEDEDTGKIYFTHVGCQLLDAGACLLQGLCEPFRPGSGLRPADASTTSRTLSWLPPSCGYRLVAEGRDLYWRHPLISGDPNTVHEAGVSVRGRVHGTEEEIPAEQLRRPHRAVAGIAAEAGAAEAAKA